MARLSGSILKLGVRKEEAKTNLCPLLAEAVSKLHDNLTPEVAFKHSVRRNYVAYEPIASR